MYSDHKKKCWYAYIQGNPLHTNSYYRANAEPAFRTGPNICAIYTKNNGIHPGEFSDKFKNYIVNALITGVPQPCDGGEAVVLLKK